MEILRRLYLVPKSLTNNPVIVRMSYLIQGSNARDHSSTKFPP